MNEFNLKQIAERNQIKYDYGQKHRYDHGKKRNKLQTWEIKAARGIMSDLLNRRGIKWEFYKIDNPKIRNEIVNAMAAIIGIAYKDKKKD